MSQARPNRRATQSRRGTDAEPTRRRALLSVADKQGLEPLAKGLCALGFEIVSTGGTAKALRDGGLACLDISQVTNFPEMLDGRVKTLHPMVHGGLLARRDLPEHMKTIAEHGIGLIDVVCVNLYPFRETARKPGVSPEDVIEQIDIGGPSMLRSAAKNHASVIVVVDPEMGGLEREAQALLVRADRALGAAELGDETIAIGVLGFLGVGLPPPDPDWGGMVKEAYGMIFVWPHMTIIPALAISSLVIGANFLATGIREASLDG